eukprot:427486_1
MSTISTSTGSLELLETGLGLLDHERVVSSAKSTISGDTADGDLLYLTLGKKRNVGGVSSHTLNKSSENGLKSLGEGTGGKNGILGTTYLGSSYKLHGHGNLLGVLDSGDTVTDGCSW